MKLPARVPAALKGLVDRARTLLKLPPAARPSPEPAPEAEEGFPGADSIIAPKKAGSRAEGGKGGKRAKAAPKVKVDYREILASLLKSKTLVVSLVAALGFLLVLAVTGIVVAAPAKPLPLAAGPTREGAALVRRMIVPPRSSLAARMVMEREDAAAYTLGDAVLLGIDWDAIDLAGLGARNDVAADELYGTVR
jgi:hypothetical protein